MRVQGKRAWIARQFMAAQMGIENGVISHIHEYDAGPTDEDYGDKKIVPGFIDIHIHGAYDFDTNDGQPEGFHNWMKRIPKEDVIAILPTTVTQMPDVLARVVTSVAAVVKEGYEGAEILSIHFEGPFLNMRYRGAQPPEAITSASVGQFKEYQKAIGGLIKYITLTPERGLDHALTGYCSAHGAMVSVGHSVAAYEQAPLGIADSALSMTHVYNSMTPCHYHELGLVDTAFGVRDIYGEIICDGCRSHLAALSDFFTARGRGYSIMVSDSLRTRRCPPGERYQLGGHDIEIGEDGLAHLEGAETITGGTFNVNGGLKVLIEQALAPFDAALNSCTANPARCLGADHRKGRIATGRDGDLMVLDDDYGVSQAWCRGRVML